MSVLTSDELADLLSLGRLDRVVLVLVVPEVQGEHVGRSGPSPHGGERPRLEDLFGLLVQPEHGVLGHAQEPRDELVPLPKFLLREAKNAQSDFIIELNGHFRFTTVGLTDFLLYRIEICLRERRR